jgi:hypothetical protein
VEVVVIGAFVDESSSSEASSNKWGKNECENLLSQVENEILPSKV